ncbi:MAG: YkgJ family cysteine cluster protein [Euryarchaeota archaeon]|nr:YkgJ family cysteine cluster protein [Euryarchaeota archaeon]
MTDLPRLPMAPPDPLTHAGAVSPCVENACSKCCHDTEMPLLPADIERLEMRTGRQVETFSVPDPDGGLRLANSGGRCVFLGTEGCTVYDDRPAGCRVYPLVWDPDGRRGVLDPDCPHTRRFRVRPKDRAALAGLLDALGHG